MWQNKLIDDDDILIKQTTAQAVERLTKDELWGIENGLLKQEIDFMRKLLFLNSKIAKTSDPREIATLLERELDIKGVAKYKASFDPEKTCWVVKVVDLFGNVVSRAFQEETPLADEISEGNKYYKMKNTVLDDRINFVTEEELKYPDQDQVVLIPETINEYEKNIFKLETKIDSPQINKILYADNQDYILQMLHTVFARLTVISQYDYAGKIIDVFNELDKLFDNTGKVYTDSGKIIIQEIRKAFGFDEAAGYTADLTLAKLNDQAKAIYCWGQENYPSVNVEDHFVSKGIKTFYIMYMLARKTGDYSKLVELMPRFYEHQENKDFLIIEDDEGNLLMFVIENMEAFDDPQSILEMEIKDQYDLDLKRENYRDIPREFFRQIAFIHLYMDEERIDCNMVRNLLGCRDLGKFKSLYIDSAWFRLTLKNLIYRYQKQLHEINIRNELADLRQKGDVVTSLIQHDLRNPLIQIGVGAGVLANKIKNYKNKILTISENDQTQLLSSMEKKYESMVDNIIKVEYLINAIKDQYDDVFEDNSKSFEVIENVIRKAEFHREQLNKAGVFLNTFVAQEIFSNKIFFIGGQNLFNALIDNIIDNAYKYTNLYRKTNKLKKRSKSTISINFDLRNSDSKFCNEQILGINIENPGFLVPQERLDEIIEKISLGEDVGPDKDNLNELKKQGFSTHGVGLVKSVNAVLRKGGKLNMYSLPEGGIRVRIEIFVNVKPKDPL